EQGERRTCRPSERRLRAWTVRRALPDDGRCLAPRVGPRDPVIGALTSRATDGDDGREQRQIPSMHTGQCDSRLIYQTAVLESERLLAAIAAVWYSVLALYLRSPPPCQREG